MFKDFIQIAGIIDKEEAEMLIKCGVEYLGFPLRLAVNKEDLSDETAAGIISLFRPSIHGVLITYLNKADEIKALSDKIGTKIIQVHGDIPIEELVELKKIFPQSTIIKSLIVGKNTDKELLETVSKLESYIDAFITDTYDPQTGATGATGITHNWDISRMLVERSNKPVILAGGLTPENVYDSILHVKPAGVDVHTGVENNSGRKNMSLVFKFIKEAKRGFERKNQNDL
ncbi:Phosphoribosylanthranilate isomerase [hydrothermal vent metagenome]|uniref:phosphoribosylanthranilate isomerase n=1 Tax=hydrothermal vent metagenome TaxID=652676 RepID=A0A3B1CT11_9ZZZZ